MPDDRATTPPRTERRLAAILAADISGYSALMGADEDATVRDLKAHQEVILPLVAANGGRVIDTAGDGILAEFPSVLNALTCAVVMQDVMEERNARVETARRMQFRIGVNQGDVLSDGVRLYGDGVNIAARLEMIAPPGGICISSKVYEEVRGKIDIDYEDAGEQTLKNIVQPVRVYRLRRQRGETTAGAPVSTAASTRRAASRKLQTAVARRGIARQQLANRTGLSLALIDTALAGDYTDETLARIEAALADERPVDMPPELGGALNVSASFGTAPLDIGGYTRMATDHYAGTYLTIRPSFSGNGTIYCYCTQISWSERETCLVFDETKRPEAQYQHSGRVYIPPSSSFIHLVSLTKGAMRTVLVSQLAQTQEMRGLITTLANDTGAIFIPASAPIVYQRRASLEGLHFGHLTPDDPDYEDYRTLLRDTVRKSFVRMILAN